MMRPLSYASLSTRVSSDRARGTAGRWLLRLLLLAAASLLPVIANGGPRGAQAVLGNEFVISAKADQQQRTLDATWHAATGQFLTVWSEHPNHSVGTTETHSGDDVIRGQLVNLDSTLAGGDFLISSSGASKDFPQVAHVGSTNNQAQLLSLAVWMDRRDGGDDIWAQLLAPAGNTLQGGNFKISGDGEDLFPAIAHGAIDPNNGVFLVVWERESATGESDVFARIVRAATTTGNPGDLPAARFQVSTATSGRASAPAIAYDPQNNQFLIVWGDDRGGSAEEREIWGQLVDTAGNLVGGNFQVSAQSGFEYAPSVRHHAEQGEFLAVWNRKTSTFAAADVHAQRISNAGALNGSRIDVAVTGQQEEASDFDVDPYTGRYIIPLTTGPTAVDRNRLEMQKLDIAGNLVGTREQVATDTVENKGPATAVFGSTTVGPGAGVSALSETLVVWRDARSAVDPDRLLSQDIYGRTVEVNTDTDGDGLLDVWETSGYVDANDNGVLDGADLNFNAFPAANRPDVNHKDLYVEVDWMQVDADNDNIVVNDPNSPGDHTHAPIAVAGSNPTGTSLDAVITAFANAPVVTNPDATGGIRLHLDLGQMGGGGAIAETAGVDFEAGFEAVKNANFATNRLRVFRYGLFKHENSGRGEIWGNDFWVGGGSNTQVLQTVTFMHEFGHTLALRHGGGDNTNCKPNYFSIMSYTHSNTGIAPGFRFDYSSQTLPTLNETNLNEGVTLGDGNDQTMFSTPGGAVGPNANTAGNVNINWDNDGTTGESGAAVNNNNINNMPPLTCPSAASEATLTGFNDWANIRYNWRSSPHVDDNVHIFHDEEDGTPAARDFMVAQIGEPALALDKTGTAAGIPGDAVSYDVKLDNAGPGPARNVAVVDTWPAGLTFTSASLAPDSNVLNGDGSRTLRWNIDPIASAGSLTITLSGSIDFPPAADSVTQAVTVDHQNVIGTPKPQLNDSVVTDIQFPEIEASKIATTSANAGEAITYTITYENTGDAPAQGVVLSDTLPAEVYYSIALDQGAGPTPNSVVLNGDGTRTLTWYIGTVAVGSGEQTISYTARTSLLVTGGTVANDASLDFSDANGNDYPAVPVSASTAITVVPPSRDVRTLGFWSNHPELWAAEIRARIQATDQRYDGIDGSVPDGALSALEVATMYLPGGNQPTVLRKQLLSVYFNLATRRINASTAISSKKTTKLGLTSVHDAAIYAVWTLLLPVNATNRPRYSDINTVLDEINGNKSEVY